MCAPFALLDGETLSLGEPTLGARSYLAVRGGIDVDPVLGSRSSDSMSGIGPAPLSAGTRLPVGRAPLFQMVGAPEESTLRLGKGSAELRITLGRGTTGLIPGPWGRSRGRIGSPLSSPTESVCGLSPPEAVPSNETPIAAPASSRVKARLPAHSKFHPAATRSFSWPTTR